jgi:hypothetical protein
MPGIMKSVRIRSGGALANYREPRGRRSRDETFHPPHIAARRARPRAVGWRPIMRVLLAHRRELAAVLDGPAAASDALQGWLAQP